MARSKYTFLYHSARNRKFVDLYGAFPVKGLLPVAGQLIRWLLFAVVSSSLFGAGKTVLRPVACDQIPGARGGDLIAGDGTKNGEMSLSSKLGRVTAPVGVMIRGELAIRAHLSRHKLVCGRSA